MRTRRMALHRALGNSSLILVLLFVVSGLLIVHDMLTRDGSFAKVFGPRLAFADLSTVLYFVFTYAMAIYYRNNVQLHARFMVCNALPLIPPALVRALHGFLPAMTFNQRLHACFTVSELITLALPYNDTRPGKVRAPYLILLGVLLVQHASFVWALQFGPWRAVVAWIVAL